MRNLLALAAAALIAFIVVGWFLGWYQVEKSGNEIKVDFNTPKITQDINKGKAKVEGFLTKQPNTTTPSPAPAPTPPNTPPNAPPRITIVPVSQDGTIVLPGSPETPVNSGPPGLPPPLPPR